MLSLSACSVFIPPSAVFNRDLALEPSFSNDHILFVLPEIHMKVQDASVCIYSNLAILLAVSVSVLDAPPGATAAAKGSNVPLWCGFSLRNVTCHSRMSWPVTFHHSTKMETHPGDDNIFVNLCTADNSTLCTTPLLAVCHTSRRLLSENQSLDRKHLFPSLFA